jgi:outer membrane cobalamin receptor
MKKMTYAFRAALCLCMMSSISLFAQERDSCFLLKGVDIKSLKKSNARTDYMPEIFPANSLQSQFGDIYIRNTGFGQSSTISLRGMGAQNITLLWNELPINSPSQGLYDLNQIPSFLTQSLNFDIDNNRLTTAGSFSLSHPNRNENYLAISSTAYLSSLYSHKLEANAKLGKGNISINQQYIHGVNNFEYLNALGERKRMDNNGQAQSNTQVSISYPIAKNWEIQSGIWYLHTNRVNPGTQTFPSKANLRDNNLRTFVGVKNDHLTVKLAYYNEKRDYFPNDGFSANSTFETQTFRGYVHYHTKFADKFKIDYKLYPSRFVMNATNYKQEEIIHEASQQINLAYSPTENWTIDGGIKSVTHSYFANLFLPFLSATYKASDKLSVQLIGDINQRNPNADELFYNIVDPFFSYTGNRNLEPEMNYQLRNVWRYEHKGATDKIRLNVEPYMLISNDNIKDTFSADFSFGQPINISKVRNYGIQTHIEWLRSLKSNQFFRTIVSFNYIDSKDGDGRYLTYVPSLKNILTLEYINPKYEIQMTNNYTSQRYINGNNAMRLNPYFLTNIKGTYKQSLKRNQINWSLGIDNLWNENYQEINGYSMPLRNYYVSVTAIIK